jgi:hypothetical protein
MAGQMSLPLGSMRDAEGDMTHQHRPCNPKQQLYEGRPGTTLVCPDCHQSMQGIRYEYGIGLLTLPVHFDPLSVNTFRMLRSERLFRRRPVRS